MQSFIFLFIIRLEGIYRFLDETGRNRNFRSVTNANALWSNQIMHVTCIPILTPYLIYEVTNYRKTKENKKKKLS